MPSCLPSAMVCSKQGGKTKGVAFLLRIMAVLKRSCVWWFPAEIGRRPRACLRFAGLGSSLEVGISEKFEVWLGRVGFFNENPATT